MYQVEIGRRNSRSESKKYTDIRKVRVVVLDMTMLNVAV